MVAGNKMNMVVLLGDRGWPVPHDLVSCKNWNHLVDSVHLTGGNAQDRLCVTEVLILT